MDRPFEPPTFAPIDRNLIQADLLTQSEIDWLDAYHATVLERVGPLLPEDAREWLAGQTLPFRASGLAC